MLGCIGRQHAACAHCIRFQKVQAQLICQDEEPAPSAAASLGQQSWAMPAHLVRLGQVQEDSICPAVHVLREPALLNVPLRHSDQAAQPILLKLCIASQTDRCTVSPNSIPMQNGGWRLRAPTGMYALQAQPSVCKGAEAHTSDSSASHPQRQIRQGSEPWAAMCTRCS